MTDSKGFAAIPLVPANGMPGCYVALIGADEDLVLYDSGTGKVSNLGPTSLQSMLKRMADDAAARIVEEEERAAARRRELRWML